MNTNEIIAILPQLILSAAIVLQLLLIAWRRSTTLIQVFSFGSLVIALVALIQIKMTIGHFVTPLFLVDAFGSYAVALILISGMVCIHISGQYLKTSGEVHDEYYVLILLTILGATLLVISRHFASVFLGFELISISLIGLVGYLRERDHTIEASFKYLVLSASASSFLLLGMAFIYAYTGNLQFDQLAVINSNQPLIILQAGTILFLAGLFFKLSLAPFHLWTPDVYHGAPAPVALLLATVSKTAMFVILIKFWFFSKQFNVDTLILVLGTVAILSMLIGNLLALKQKNIKRLLAYSSIAHMGYLLVILMFTSSSSVQLAFESAQYYLTAYVLATLILFMVISLLSRADEETDADDWQQWKGMFWRQPWLATAIIFALLSLAGIPLTAGFIGKFYLISTAVINQSWWMLFALVLGSGIGLFYYLSIIINLFNADGKNSKDTSQAIPLLSKLVLVSMVLAVLLLGILPSAFTIHLGDIAAATLS